MGIEDLTPLPRTTRSTSSRLPTTTNSSLSSPGSLAMRSLSQVARLGWLQSHSTCG